LQIKTQTSKLLARTEPNHYSHQISTRTPSYKKNYRVLITHDQYAPPVGSQSRAAVDSGTSAPSHQSNRLAQYLATIEDPVGGQYQFWYQIHSSILQVRGHTGPLVVRRWSRDGREQYAALSARDGYSGSIDFESFNFARRKLSLKIFVQYNRLNLLGLSIRLNFRASALFSFDGPHHRAIAVGDRGYLRQKLSERSLSPYDSTPNGDTLLHVCTTCVTGSVPSLILI
jgi:hypothetical protein